MSITIGATAQKPDDQNISVELSGQEVAMLVSALSDSMLPARFASALIQRLRAAQRSTHDIKSPDTEPKP